MKIKLTGLLDKIQRSTMILAIQRTLVMLIPVLLIGSFAALLEALPIEAYTAFITTWCGGILYKLFDMLHSITFGMFAVYMAAIIGYQIGAMKSKTDQSRKYGTMVASIGCLFILSDVMTGKIGTLGGYRMLIAILAAGVGSWLYLFAADHTKRKQLMTDGSDQNLRNAIHSIFPMIFTLVVVALGNSILLQISRKENFYDLLISLIAVLFGHLGIGVAGSLVYMTLNDLLWFFGIHGSDVIVGISKMLNNSSMEQNLAATQGSQAGVEIITTSFANSFVMIGGCGATLCLLLALSLFSRRKGIRSLTKISVIPMLFNINEIMVFGLPIIFNVFFLIPFLLVPVICFFISYFALHTGLVPLAVNDIPWTTPVFISGYLATGSVRGVLLQIVNLAVGTAIYAPFVKLYDKKKMELSQSDYELMVETFQESEAAGKQIPIMDSSLSFGWMAKALAADLEYAFGHGELKLFYQPQYNEEDECIGVEALLRWHHGSLGWIYPPLIFRIAEEVGIREKLEEWVIEKGIEDAETLQNKYSGKRIKVSINVTGTSIQEKRFEDYLEKMAVLHDIRSLNICLEITEQDALLLDDTLRERFRHLQELGYALAVDDFSMGSTSIRYLTGSHFELVKLDGSLVKGILDNPRCCEIIASIIHLSDSLGVEVLAEYVSDAQIREKLLEVGCHLYQGWYYSPAIPLEEFEKLMEKKE